MLLPALVELVGTFIFLSVIIGTGQAVAIAATLFAVIMWGGSISGGNFNPAISAMFFVKGDISAQKFIIYVVAQYLVRQGRQGFTANGQPVVVPAGDYDGPALAAAVQAAGAAVVPSLSVAHDPARDSFTFTAGAGNITLDFTAAGSMHRALGFAAGVYGPAGSIAAPFKRDDGTRDYMVLNIDQFDVNKSMNKWLNRSFAVFNKDGVLTYRARNERVVKFFNPPLARVSKLRISFKDSDGLPVDFQNLEHRLDILLISSRNRRKYRPMQEVPSALA
eukprot:jgi/Chrzof1/9275/UNPLg00242.t1